MSHAPRRPEPTAVDAAQNLSIRRACQQIEASAGALLATEDRQQLVALPLWHAIYEVQAAATTQSPHHQAAAQALANVMRAIVDGVTDAYVALPFVASAAATLGSQWQASGAALAMQAVTFELATLLPVPGRAPAPKPTNATSGRLMFRVTELVIPSAAACAAALDLANHADGHL